MKWLGKVQNCDICGSALKTQFVDGKTTFGPWGMLCPECHKKHGVGLGTGKGQLYEKQGNDWVKIQ
jgi:hypothetical protein